MTDLQFALGMALAALAVGVLSLFVWSGVAIGLRDLDARLRRIAAEAARDALAEAQAGRARRQNLDPALVRVPVMTLAEFDAVHAPTNGPVAKSKGQVSGVELQDGFAHVIARVDGTYENIERVLGRPVPRLDPDCDPRGRQPS